MMSHREASRAWGVSRATIQRAIKAGKLSLTPEKTIDPAEMARVFGEPTSRLESRPAIPDEAGGEPGVSHPKHDRLMALEIENATLKALLVEKDARIADLKQTFLVIDHERPRRRWWPFGRG